MSQHEPSSTLSLRFLVVVGLLWAVTEVTFGTLLKAGCPRGMTGSVLTGVSMLFISAAYHLGARSALLIPLSLVIGGKALGAAVLGRPLLHGSVVNPCYAYATETLALMIVVGLMGTRRMARPVNAVGAGALTAVAAIGLFLPVGLVTGKAACIHASSGIPLAVYYGPLAVAISAATVPLGRLVGLHAAAWIGRAPAGALRPRMALDLASLAALAALLLAHIAAS